MTAIQERARRRVAIEAVAIGASAGGVEALGILLRRLRRGFAASVLVVIHIPAGNGDLLQKVLAPGCALPVREAEDKESVAPGIVYLAAPGYHLLVEPDRTLALSVDTPVHYARPSIDVLFESAAYAYRQRLLAIVLSGANADGSRGLACVRALGGLAWVQDPATALAATMPESAILAAGADRILSLEAIADALAALPSDRGS
jgi:two-component system chemotaxis response regulator CheB